MLGLGNMMSGGSIPRFPAAISFDGVNDYAIIPNVAALRPTSGLTVSFWAKPSAWDMTTNGQTDYFLGCLAAGGWGGYLSNTFGNATTIKGIISVANNGSSSPGYLEPIVNEATTEALSGWKHIVMTYDGTTAKLYVNASTSGVTNAAHGVGSSQAINYHSVQPRPLFLGADAANDTVDENPYLGLLSEVAVWNSALTSAEITVIYNSGEPFSPIANSGDYTSSSDLVGYWKLDEGAGTVLYDSSTNSNNGAPGDFWTWTYDTPFS